MQTLCMHAELHAHTCDAPLPRDRGSATVCADKPSCRLRVISYGLARDVKSARLDLAIVVVIARLRWSQGDMIQDALFPPARPLVQS